jgi:hypothetical protein
MQQCQILEGRFPNHKQTIASLRAAEHAVLSDECERLAITYCPHGAARMLIAAFVAGTCGMTLQPNAEVAGLFEGLAKKFK